MDHYRLSDELRQQLLENAAWGKVGVTPRLDEACADMPKKGKKAKKKEPEMEMEDAEYEDEGGRYGYIMSIL